MIPLLQARLLGRSFTTDEERLDGPNAAILSASVWRTRFGGGLDVIGKTLIANSVPRVIVGVMPDGFVFPDADTRLWLPVKVDPSSTVRRLQLLGRGASRRRRESRGCTARLASVLPRIAGRFRGSNLERRRRRGSTRLGLRRSCRRCATRSPTGSRIRCGSRRRGGPRAHRRVGERHESHVDLRRRPAARVAVREALGASRLRIMTHFFGETFVLTTAAGAVRCSWRGEPCARWWRLDRPTSLVLRRSESTE